VKVSGLGHFPLGCPVPKKSHAVCVSLPTIEDLIGYEEKNPDTVNAISSGYPRFVSHPSIIDLSKHLDRMDGSDQFETFLLSNSSDLQFASEVCNLTAAKIITEEEFTGIRIPYESNQCKKLQKFLQHTGCGMSSRKAERTLESLGLITPTESIIPNQNAANEIRSTIAKAHGNGIDSEDVLLASSGANAFTATFRAALEQSRIKGKGIWIRLGWLYLDTTEIMDLLTNNTEQVLELNHPRSFNKLDDIFETSGEKIAGIVTEFPSNPLLQCCELEKVSELCKRYGALLVVDPTMASPKNAKISGLADIVINSLTKYANWEGDTMMGCAVFPKTSSLGLEIKENIQNYLAPPFQKDMERLAEQIPFYENFIEKTNQAQMEMVDFLSAHPKIEKVYHAYSDSTGHNYSKIAEEDKPGCVLSFEIKGNFKDFYNALPMLKSPSFGTEFSICCPYIYLAHYDKLSTKEGRQELENADLRPELCRLSVGLEDPDEIKSAIAEGLNAT